MSDQYKRSFLSCRTAPGIVAVIVLSRGIPERLDHIKRKVRNSGRPA